MFSNSRIYLYLSLILKMSSMFNVSQMKNYNLNILRNSNQIGITSDLTSDERFLLICFSNKLNKAKCDVVNIQEKL